jgi:cytochrome P450
LDPKAAFQLTPHEIAFTAFDLLVAGHETTSHTMAWVIRLLASNQTQQTLLREKLRKHLKGRAPVYQDLRELPCLTHLLNETLRLHPTNPLVVKRSQVDEPLLGYTIPAGVRTTVMCSHLSV